MNHPDFQTGLPQQRHKLSVAEVAAYLGCEEDHVYRLIKAGEFLKAAEDPIRIDRQSVINFRIRRQLRPDTNVRSRFDPESFVPHTQRAFRVDQIAELLVVTVNHILNLIKQGEIAVPKERIDSAPSGASILVPRESLVRFVKRRRNSPTRLAANKRRRQRLKEGQR
jgi:predicted DNA-binding transcriptional regulator AlpA